MSSEESAPTKSGGLSMIDRLVAQLADTICSVATQYEDPKVVFCRTIDCILLGLGAPYVLKVSPTDGMAATLVTGSLDESKFDGAETDFCGALLINVHRRCSVDGPQRELAFWNAHARRFIAQLSKAVLRHQDGNPRVREDFVAKLREGLLCMTTSAQAPRTREHSAPGGKELDNIFHAIDTQLKDFSKAYQLGGPAKDGRGSFMRLMFCRRFIDPAGKLQVQMHLLPSQREALEGSRHDGRHAAAILSDHADPLTSAAVSTGLAAVPWDDLDATFRSGITAWIRWPWDIPGYKPDEHSQTEATRRIFTAPGNPLLGPGIRKSTVLAIPIHVGGVPWIIVLVAFLDSELHNGRLDFCYNLYRDTIGQLSARIRQLARSSYDDALGAVLLRFEQSIHPDLGGLNRDIEKVTLQFPFSTYVFEADNGLHPRQDNTIELNGETVSFRSVQNDLLTESIPVPYEDLPDDHLATILNDAHRGRARYDQHRLSSYEDIGHALKNIVDVTCWESAAHELYRSRLILDNQRKQKGGRRRALSAQQFDEVAQAIDWGCRSLTMSAMAQGLGHFVRLAAADTGRYEWKKFAKWIDDKALRIWDEGKLEHIFDDYASSVFAITRAICFGRGWEHGIVECPAATRENLRVQKYSRNEQFEPLLMEQLAFPPFARGSEAIYVFFFALAEPIVNAIRALDRSRVRVGDQEPIRIRIEAGDAARGEILVHIANRSSDPVPQELSGLQSIRHLFRGMGFISYSKLASTKLEPHLYEVSVTVCFRPDAFIRKVRLQKNKGGAPCPRKSSHEN